MQERRNETGSGVGKRSGEGGTNRETATRTTWRERERERELEKWEGKCMDLFCLCGAEELFPPFLRLIFFPCFPARPARLHSRPSLCALLVFDPPPCFTAPPVCLSAALTPSPRSSPWPPLPGFLLPSRSARVFPRMHLFKSCFTETEQVEKSVTDFCFVRFRRHPEAHL